MIRAGVMLGLVETEPVSALSRAYIRSHDGLHWLRSQLLDSHLTEVEETLCRYHKRGKIYTIRFRDGLLTVDPARSSPRRAIPLAFDPQSVDELDLGPQSFVAFSYRDQELHIKLQAGDNSLGEVGVAPVELRLRVPLTSL